MPVPSCILDFNNIMREMAEFEHEFFGDRKFLFYFLFIRDIIELARRIMLQRKKMFGEIIVSFIETFLVFIYFILVLQSKSKKLAASGALLLAAFVSILNVIGTNSDSTIILCMLAQASYAFFCFKGSRFERMFYGCSFAVIVSASEQVTFKMAGLSKILPPSENRYGMMPIYYLSCLILILIIACYMKNRMALPVSYRIPLIIMLVCGVRALEKMLDIIIKLNGIKGIESSVNVLEDVSLFWLIVFLAMMYMIMKTAALYQTRNALLKKQNEEQYILKEYEFMKSNMETLRGWKHDMKNHLRVISGLIDNKKDEEASLYITKIFGNIDNKTILIGAANPVLDVIIANKYLNAKNAGIEFSFQIYVEEDLSLESIELTTILGNILDNAIEANLKLDAEKNRFIDIKIRTLLRMLQISVINSCNGVYKMEGDDFISTKNTNSGLGLRQVKKALERIGGFMEVSAEKESFKVKACIPLE